MASTTSTNNYSCNAWALWAKACNGISRSFHWASGGPRDFEVINWTVCVSQDSMNILGLRLSCLQNISLKNPPATIWSRDLFRACFLSRNTWKEKPTELPSQCLRSTYCIQEIPRQLRWRLGSISLCLDFKNISRGPKFVESWKESFFPIPKSAIQSSANQDFKECRDIQRKNLQN